MKNLKYVTIALLLLTVNAVKAQTVTPINKVLDNYLAIKNALADDNSKLANQKAKDFTVSLKDVSNKDLNARQKAAWLKYGEKLRFDGDHISESASIDHQREHFGNLSKNMITVLKVFKSNTVTMYAQYCPMKKQSWLSETAAIKNPYYGKEMSGCGSTTTTLKAANK
jgi:hypothetical protein